MKDNEDALFGERSMSDIVSKVAARYEDIQLDFDEDAFIGVEYFDGDVIPRRIKGTSKLDISDEELEMVELIQAKAKHNLHHNLRWLMDKPYKYMIRRIMLFSYQTFGKFLQNYFMQDHKRIRESQDSGDVFNFYNEIVEVKCSSLREENGRRKVDVVHVRLWQKVSKYKIFVIHPHCPSEPYKLYVFTLSKKQMQEEMDLIGGPMSGTKKANEKNENVEMRMSIPWVYSNVHFQRWMRFYREENVDYWLREKQSEVLEVLE